MALVRFIGCPASGKTTTAAMVFAKLKDQGTASEFVPEQARIHIAELRFNQQLAPEAPLSLSDDDQIKILKRQVEIEELMTKVCGPEVVVVTDTSPLSALLYMSSEARMKPEVEALIERCLKLEALWFYTPPISDYYNTFDPNRVHSAEQSKKIDLLIPKILNDFAPELHVVTLTGNAEQRARNVTADVYSYMLQI